MIPAATANIFNYQPFSRNCKLGQCGRKYLAPVPTLGDVQLYVNFGAVKPASFEIAIIDLCHPAQSETVTAGCYMIGWSGSYYYGIFKNLSSTANYDTFIIALRAGTETFFSEQYQLPTDCDTLIKISVCYPSNYNAEDINCIYIGLPDITQPYAGKPDIFYHHTFWTRQGEIVETSNKISFVASAYKNFASTLTKQFELRPEPVPGWYKDYLLSVYFRGDILIDGAHALVTDINFEDIDVDYWKAYAVLSKEVKGGFGCTPYNCPDNDCVCVAPTLPETAFGSVGAGQPYTKTIPFTGTWPVNINEDSEIPSWLEAEIVGTNIVLSGTPLSGDIGTDDIYIKISNPCGDAQITGDIYITDPPCVPAGFDIPAYLPYAYIDQEYHEEYDLTGTAPFSLLVGSKPDWLTITISGSKIIFTGTPTTSNTDSVSFVVFNCQFPINKEYNGSISSGTPCVEYYNNTGSSHTISWQECQSGTWHYDEPLTPGQSICTNSISGDWQYLMILGDCF